jgi:hypothetical protein
MKKFVFLLLLVGSLSVPRAYSQIAVFDAGVNTILAGSWVEQAIHYFQVIQHQIQSAMQFYTMIEHLGNQLDRTVQNLRSASDIRDFSDFMDWYNRSLYMEQQTAQAFKNMNVTIGKKSYHFTDMESMAYGFKDEYVDYWDREFTPEQRREMWLELGMTPANYAYVQPFRNEMNEWRRQGFAAEHIQNRLYMEQMKRNNERQARLARDKTLPTNEKMGDKEVLMLLLESSMESNRVLNDMAMYQALEMKRRATEMYLKTPPEGAPPLSDWSETGFRPLDK